MSLAPPFTAETAHKKVKAAQNLWNTQLRKELFAFSSNRIAVQFWYEYQDSHDNMKWKRCYGLEDWTYDDEDGGKMRKRQMSGNDVEIAEGQRWFKEGVDVDSVEIGEEHW
ncbi:hypothetical protein LTS09_007711 [Friedmanniomyces endolithicus]|nr:hypothetical protein LTS09_007711 [Friedmanniomyces endolithicus]